MAAGAGSSVLSLVGGVAQIFTVCHCWVSRRFIVLVLVAFGGSLE